MMKAANSRHLKGLLALSPMVVFLAAYMVSSIVAGDFYRVPVSSAFLLACIYAVCISGGSLKERITTFSKGAGDSNLLLMLWIFILAGAFAGTAKDIGAVDATVNATLSLVPPRFIFAGLFLTACFISMAMGTSTGTVVALVPIASGIAQQLGVGVPYTAAIIVGGAFFGDNLSFISDTTIAATQAVGCDMRDKFRTNIRIILPAVIIVTVIYVLQGSQVSAAAEAQAVDWIKILPYILVIVLALTGMNVTAVLTAGIAVNAIIGWCTGSFGWISWLESTGKGISGMSDLIIVTLLAGGLLETIRKNGGLDYIMSLLSKMARGPRGAQASIAALVSIANICTANNTIAIITVSRIAADISERFGIDPRKTASILDTFSCIVQSFIPYGVQLLMAAGLAAVSPVAMIPFLYYPMGIAVCAILAIIFDYPRFKKDERH